MTTYPQTWLSCRVIRIIELKDGTWSEYIMIELLMKPMNRDSMRNAYITLVYKNNTNCTRGHICSTADETLNSYTYE